MRPVPQRPGYIIERTPVQVQERRAACRAAGRDSTQLPYPESGLRGDAPQENRSCPRTGPCPVTREGTVIGLRGLLLVVAIVLFVIGVFSDVHQGDLICWGLACTAGALLVEELGLNTRFGAPARRNT